MTAWPTLTSADIDTRDRLWFCLYAATDSLPRSLTPDFVLRIFLSMDFTRRVV